MQDGKRPEDSDPCILVHCEGMFQCAADDAADDAAAVGRIVLKR